MTLPSFLGGREVRSHQVVQGSPALGGIESRMMSRAILKTLHCLICITDPFNVQILLVRHLLLSLPWRHLDPEGKRIDIS